MSFNGFKSVIEEGDTVILYLSVTQIYALEIKPKLISKNGNPVDNIFQTKYGSLRVMDLVGVKFGSRVNLSRGWGTVLYPTPELWTLTLPHRTQILYTPDISMVVTQLEIGPGSVICEAGTGSGSLSHALLRAIGPTGKLYTCDFHKERVKVAMEEFERHGLGDRVSVTQRDVCVEGLGVSDVADAVFLDLPKPWEALPHAVNAIKTTGGRICSFSPCIEQVSRTCETMANLGLREITTLECLSREFQVKMISLPVISNDKQKTLPIEEKDQDQKLEHTDKKLKTNEEEEESDKETQVKSEEKSSDKEKNTEEKSDIKEKNTEEKSSIKEESVEKGDIKEENDAVKSLIKEENGQEKSSIKEESAENTEEKSDKEKNAAKKSDFKEKNAAKKRDIKEKNDGEKSSFKEKNGEASKIKDISFRSGITALKMPGHTGFLTFATVPPGLCRIKGNLSDIGTVVVE